MLSGCRQIARAGKRTGVIISLLLVCALPSIARPQAARSQTADSLVDGGPDSVSKTEPDASVGLPELPAELRPEVRVEVSKKEISLGDSVDLTITVIRPSADTVRVPASKPLDPWEILSRDTRTRKLEDGRIEETFTLSLICFVTGENSIPSLDLHVHKGDGTAGIVKTPPQIVTVKSVLSDARPDAGPRGLHGPVKVVHEDLTLLYALGIIAGIVIVVLLTLLIRRLWASRRNETPAPAVPARPPEEVALERLDRLAREDLPSRGMMMEYHVRLADTVREYLGGRYGFDALEMTTYEIMSNLRRKRVEGSTRNLVRTIIDECDLVKFAKYTPSVQTARSLLDSAYRLVRETTPPASAPLASAPQPTAPRASADDAYTGKARETDDEERD